MSQFLVATALFAASGQVPPDQPAPQERPNYGTHLEVQQARAKQAVPYDFAKPTLTLAQAPRAYFDWFEYRGRDRAFAQRLHPGTYRNPVLAGFYPDPSVTRAGNKFYLVNSTFTYFPGIPVFESDDLVHWRQVGNVIERAQSFNFDGLDVSRGMFAPTIRFHNGMFYVVCTAVDAGGNFLTVAKNPSGPWSDPIWLPGLEGGIDPSLFFDDNDKVYLLNNGLPEDGPRYEGHRAIWSQELDLAARKLVGPRKVLVNGGVEPAKKPIWIEGPHMYRREGWYYLMCAEGGTSTQHSEVIFRAKSPWGPFRPYAANPILTQRDLPRDRDHAIANAGHADLVEATDGSWWAVFLASRTYEGVHYNTGRETYMLPVTWHDGWPNILPPGQAIPYIVKAPYAAALARTARSPAPGGASGSAAPPSDSPVSESTSAGSRASESRVADSAVNSGVSNSRAADSAVNSGLSDSTAAGSAVTPTIPLTGNFTWRDDFNTPTLAPVWLNVRIPKQPWADLTRRPGWLTIHALRIPLESLENMSFLARRQQHLAFDAATELEVPATTGLSVGLAAFQNESYWYFVGVRRRPGAYAAPGDAPLEVFLEKRSGKQTETLTRVALDGGAHQSHDYGGGNPQSHDPGGGNPQSSARLKLKIAADARAYSFYFDADGSGWKPLKENDDGSILSTDVAGGFVGAFVGPYARAD